MGLLVDGVWRDQWYDTQSHGGRFERDAAKFRNWITPDGAPGPSGRGGFKAEAGRYHLYAAYFCPWAHRTLIFRELKGLAPLIDVSIVNWLMRENGITFAPADGVIGDPLFGARYLYEIYQAADPAYSGRVTVPTLWDKETKAIVSTESSEIIRMFNSAFDGVGAAAGDYYPTESREEIDALNARIYPTVNNGVYRAGFATTQTAYEEAIGPLFETLDYLEALLDERRYLCGERMTEADIRLLTTLLRFDIVYVGHFKCNVRRIADYPNLWGYVRDLYQTGTIAKTFRPDHIKGHYYQSHLQINPTGIVPLGPHIDFDAPHDRARLGGAG
ncbi:glutathione S-transferase family protein [Methylocella silvestris]|uniref:Glutathione-dependent reductase n=1 Tax=Methylocella silvestris TaxID=199596 RepID=A0A2J7TH05_METSI|nr:glutathione S-transferase family protein [Methylocella silvestris]PNG26039.1 glutathione-dependent reductase [Methylocella silvestris]